MSYKRRQSESEGTPCEQHQHQASQYLHPQKPLLPLTCLAMYQNFQQGQTQLTLQLLDHLLKQACHQNKRKLQIRCLAWTFSVVHPLRQRGDQPAQRRYLRAQQLHRDQISSNRYSRCMLLLLSHNHRLSMNASHHLEACNRPQASSSLALAGWTMHLADSISTLLLHLLRLK